MEKEVKTTIKIQAPCEIYKVTLVKEDDEYFWWHQARVIAFDSDSDALVLNDTLSLEKAIDIQLSGLELLTVIIVDGIVAYADSSPLLTHEFIENNIDEVKECLRKPIRHAASYEISTREKRVKVSQ